MDFRRSGRQFRGIQKRRKESSGNVKIKSLRNNANLIPKQNEYTYLSDEGSLKNENRCSTWVQKEEEVERRAEEKKWRYRPLDSIVWERGATSSCPTCGRWAASCPAPGRPGWLTWWTPFAPAWSCRTSIILAVCVSGWGCVLSYRGKHLRLLFVDGHLTAVSAQLGRRSLTF